MTVTYTSEVATCGGISCFLKLLARWRGSIYKLVWIDLVIFLFIYYTLNLIYRFGLDNEGKELFENVARYCKNSSTFIPLSFVLGFYVAIVMKRWWDQYISIPFPDSLAVYVSATIHGQDERGRLMRRTIMRYVCLCVTMMFTNISPKVKKRFPTLDHLIEAGLLLQNEKDSFSGFNKKCPSYSKHWMPIVWAASVVTRARKEGRIRDDFAVKTMLDELNKFRAKCGRIINYDRISIPLVYTQVVTLAVYSYFLITLMGHQWVEGHDYKFELYFPIFTLLQFFFYVGWLKVAESLINPFGDDDDDFELNWMIDRHLQVSYQIVDEMHHHHPELIKDQYWDEIFPPELPYTDKTLKESHPLPSTANIANAPFETEFFNRSTPKIDDIDDMHSSPFVFTAKRMAESQNSINTSISRAGSVTSLFRRLFHRVNSRNDDPTMELGQLNRNHFRRLVDQIIEEADEQLTIQSRLRENRPRVETIFQQSLPIDVPSRSVYDHYPANSPPNSPQIEDNISIGSSDHDYDNNSDQFHELKKRRSEERLNRMKLNLMRSYSLNDDEGTIK